MQSSTFTDAFKSLLEFEGGYVNDKYDPGMETKFGISKRSYPTVDIKSLTLEGAKKIYYNDFWSKNKYFQIHNSQIGCKIFHNTVNMGAKQSHIILQRALRALGNASLAEDGILGPKTLEATNKANPEILNVGLRSESAGFYRTLIAAKPVLGRFRNGWLRRAYH
jgi:lysozyme family protein